MMKLQTLGLATALGFAGAVLAQTPSPSTTTTTDSRSSTSQSTAQDSRTQDQDTLGQSSTGQGSTQAETGTPPISGSDTTGSAQTTPSSSEEDTAAADESLRTAAADTTQSKHGKHAMHRASKLIGKNVETADGNTIGEVKDVILDEQGRVTHVIVSHGRLGSTKLAAVPFEVVKRNMKGDKLVMDRTRLENAPSFEESNFPNVAGSNWSSSADRYWGRSRTASAEASAEISSDTGETSGSRENSTSAESQGNLETGTTGSQSSASYPESEGSTTPPPQ